jgi:Mor family transcriptional regulator
MSRVARASADELAPITALIDPAYPDAWARVAECLYLGLRDAGSGEATAQARLAMTLTEGLRAELGGSQLYLAKGQNFELSLRDRQILAAFNGRNHRQLAHEHGVTERYIYDIVARRSREEYERRQGKLPGLDPVEGQS